MIELGFEEAFIYECSGTGVYYGLPVMPIISLALPDPQNYKSKDKIDGMLNRSPTDFDIHTQILLFREETFDPATRIRRGRFYEKSKDGNPQDIRVFPFRGARQNQISRLTLFRQPNVEISRNQLIAIGSADSIWKVVARDRISTGEFLITLKSRNTFGVIPEIDEEKIPEIHKKEIISGLDHFVDIVNRETPSSIVDAARNIAILLISNYIFTISKDKEIFKLELGKLIKFLNDNDIKKILSSCAADIINRLHPRNKPGEREKHDLRPVTEEDSELAVHLIGFLIQEFGWAR